MQRQSLGKALTAGDNGRMGDASSRTASPPAGGEAERPRKLGRARAKATKAASFGLSIWRQIAAVFAAFAIAAVISHWWHIGWRGWLATLVGIWADTVRPAVAWLFHYLVTVPLGWIGIDFEISLFVRDYLTVGIILALSGLRATLWWRGRTGPSVEMPETNAAPFQFALKEIPRYIAGGIVIGLLLAVGLVLLIGLWPLWLIVVVSTTINENRDAKAALDALSTPPSELALRMAMARTANDEVGVLARRERDKDAFRRLVDARSFTLRALALFLAPAVYLALLLVINFSIL